MAILPIIQGVGAAFGLGSGVYGAAQAGKQKRQALKAIRNAYGIVRERQQQRQGDVRQGSLESLNARGILTGGSGSAPVLPAEQPLRTDKFGRMLQLAHRKGLYDVAGYSSDADIARQAVKGERGPANTLAGQAQRDLSKEFALEARDVNAQQNAAEQGVNAQYQQNVLNSLGTAINSAFGIAGLVDSFKGPKIPDRPSVLDNPNILPPSALPNISGAFGLDPVNPLKPRGSVAGFNVYGDQ